MDWLVVVPVALALALVAWLPGLMVLRVVGVRGLLGWAVAPAVTASVTTLGATVLAATGVRWNVWTLTATTALLCAVALAAVRWVRSRHGTGRAMPSDQPPLCQTEILAVLVAAALTLTVAVPALRSPEALVQSPDVVFHLNRIRLYSDTGTMSVTYPAFYPSAFHAWVATTMSVPQPFATFATLPSTNVATLVIAALMWPLGCVALTRVLLGPARLATVAAALASTAFVAFPTILLGWGVLLPNLMGTGLTPAVLALLVRAVQTRSATLGAGVLLAVPGLFFVQPNAIVALAVLFLAWVVTVRTQAAARGRLSGRRVAVELGALVTVSAVTAVVLPQVSALLASTSSYVWEDKVSVPQALTEVMAGHLQVTRPLWGVVVLVVLGVAWVTTRDRRGLPALAMWLAAVVLYTIAATVESSWASLVTGFWYNDKVRLAALAVVPAVVLTVAGTLMLRQIVARLWPRAWADSGSAMRPAAFATVVLVGAATVALNAPLQHQIIENYFYPLEENKQILTMEGRRDLSTLARVVPAGEAVIARPENGTPLMYALYGTDTLYRSIPIPASGDGLLLGTRFADLASDPEVCAALHRHRVRWAIESPHVYWLDKPERSSGLMQLSTVPGVERVQSVGAYTLYRITGCV